MSKNNEKNDSGRLPESQRLQELFESKQKESGLVDVKFLASSQSVNGGDITAAIKEAEAVVNDIENGDYVDVSKDRI